MTQEEKWRKNYAEVVEYMDTYHRNPSKHRVEDLLLLNWMKHQRKLMNRGELKPDRVEKFKRLLAKSESLKRVNQWEVAVEEIMKNDALRNYQQEMIDRLEGAWKQYRSVMLQMPTGTGKTVLMAEVIRRKMAEVRRKNSDGILIVAHRRELLDQIRGTVKYFGIDMEKEHVVVESIQKLSRGGYPTPNPSPKKGGEFSPSLVIIDEAHHALAKTYRMLWDRWPKAKFLGLTATPCRLNNEGFLDLFQTLVQSHTIQEFIQMGWLSDFDYVTAEPDNPILKQVASLKKRGVDGDYQTREMAMVMDCEESIENLYQAYRKFVNGKKGIVYAIDREHARHITEYYQRQGVRCAMIDAKTPKEERDRIVEEYRSTPPLTPPLIGAGSSKRDSLIGAGSSERDPLIGAGSSERDSLIGAGSSKRDPLIGAGSSERDSLIGAGSSKRDPLIGAGSSERDPLIGAGSSERDPLKGAGSACGRSGAYGIDVLVNVDIFGEGFDVPEVEFIQLARPTLSLSKYLQQVGRGMRIAEGKDKVVILDHVGMYQSFGLPTEDWNWPLMFTGQMAGKAGMGREGLLYVRGDGYEKELINTHMVSIKRKDEAHRGLEIFMKDGLYGIAKDGRMIHQPLFERIRRADDGYFAYCTYPYLVYKCRSTIIDKDGRDLGLKMYGNLEWVGASLLKGLDVNGEELYWDRRYNQYYHEKPEFVSLGGVEMTRLKAGYVLRKYPMLIKPISKRKIYYNSNIIWMDDWLISKYDSAAEGDYRPQRILSYGYKSFYVKTATTDLPDVTIIDKEGHLIGRCWKVPERDAHKFPDWQQTPLTNAETREVGFPIKR